MGNRGSKSPLWKGLNCLTILFACVKEQRVDGYSVLDINFLNAVRCTLVAGKAGSWKKLSNSRLKIAQ